MGGAFQAPFDQFDRLFRFIWFGFALSAISGGALLIADPVTKLSQGVFYAKLLLVALAMTNVHAMRKCVFRRGDRDERLPPIAKPLAVISLIFEGPWQLDTEHHTPTA